jgi:hypothetical protein
MRMIYLLAGVVVGFGLLAGEASAITSLTQEQVRNVCAPDLKKTPGHFGCTKKCANGKDTCIYDCSEKTGDCNGLAVPLGGGR